MLPMVRAQKLVGWRASSLALARKSLPGGAVRLSIIGVDQAFACSKCCAATCAEIGLLHPLNAEVIGSVNRWNWIRHASGAGSSDPILKVGQPLRLCGRSI